MMQFETTPLYTLGLPLAALVGSWLVSKVLRVSLVIALLGACVPLALPFMELPFAHDFSVEHPEYLIGGGWAVLVALLIGWVVVRPLLSGALQGVGLIKGAYLVVLAVALGVVGMLLINPPTLDRYLPGWHGTAGIVLLCASLLSMALALARVVRAAVVFAVWAFVSVILASEVFLQKLPHEVVREDLRVLEPFLPVREFDTVLRHLSIPPISGASPEATSAATSAVASLRAFVLSGSAAAGYPLPEDERVAGQLARLFERSGVAAEVRDISLLGASVYEQKELVSKVVQAKPDLVVIMGWGSDSERGVNSYGLPGMNESEARRRVARLSELQRYPLVQAVLTSSLYRFALGDSKSPGRFIASEDTPQRVPADHYEKILAEVVAAYAKAGVRVVLASEPFEHSDGAAYRDAMERVAQQHQARFIDTGSVLGGHAVMVSRGHLLSREGCRAIAQATIDSLLAAERMHKDAGAQAGSDERLGDPIARGVEPQREDRLGEVLAVKGAELAGRERHGKYLGVVGDTERGEPLRMVVRPSEIDGDLLFKVKIHEQGARFYRVVFSINGEFVADRRLDAREGTNVRFQLPDAYRSLPFVEVELRTVASPPPESDRIRGSDAYALVPIQVRTAPQQPTMIRIDGDVAHAGESFFATSVDYRSGERVSSVRSDDPRVFARWVMQQGWGNLVVGGVARRREVEGALGTAVDGDGGLAMQAASVQAAPVQAALSFIGVGERGAAFQGDFGFVGVAGIKGAQARVALPTESGQHGIELAMGGPITKAYTRFTVEEMSVGGRALKTYGGVS